ncbi:PREDICTED: uncharacterized protein LOC105457910 [Wasmannia auropunctata]|uniref:uncharacterized protein LOC105457910 n=1 Tax=Wasmannia auropunctata TaxID=64793 RepID=UPI0005F06CC6|nr:PREDICTED: uncharacterized protein LOC105457910 [Wasmannia auropunctata]
MKHLLLFLASYVSLLLLSVYATDLNEYLNEKLRQSKIEFIKIHIQETSPVQEKSYRVHWDRSWRVPITSDHQPFTIDMFDGVFVLDGNRMMLPSLNVTSWNETYDTLREIYRIKDESVVKFVRSTVWEDTNYLLVCYDHGLCRLYTAKSNHPLRFRHTIGYIGYKGIPVDAKFFAQASQLYLIIANNADKFPIPSVIYRWSGTYMDIVREVTTTGAISVTAFMHQQSAIIVFAQSYTANPWIGSDVYEFKDNNIERIQFLSTARPTSVHHYVHGDFNFILMINDLGPSDVLCWDGGELLDWFSLPDIKPYSLIRIFHMDGDTFVVVAHDNVVQLYKFHSTSEWKSENIKRFKDNQKIVDMTVSLNEHMMNVTLILVDEKNIYWVEQWEAEMTSVSIDSNVEDTDATRKCLSDLIETLQARMPAVKEAEASWKFLLPAAENLTVSEPVNFDSLTLRSGMVDTIEIATEEDILPPHQIAKALDELERSVHDAVQAKQSKTQQETREIADMLKEKIVANDLHLEELEIDQMHVNFVNDVDMQSGKTILPEGEQHFTHPLRTKNLIVHNLEVESLCGIAPEHWLLRSDEGIASAIANSSFEYTNDTVIVSSDLTVPKLKIKSLNGIIIDQLIDDLFIINRNQNIKGTITYENSLQVTNLTARMVNGVPADKLMTTMTNQSFDDLYVETLHIENLYAETINGVPVEEAARKSRENVIKGKLKLAKLNVIEELVIDMNDSMIKIPDERLQIYQNVTILGDLHIQNIKVENAAELFVEDVPVNVSDMFDRHWTKSTDQTITEKITLEAGITIDKLDTKYLNGFAESDFLYTTMEEIPSDFSNLRFEDFHVEQFSNENEGKSSFFEVEPNSITIREMLHVQTLRAKDILTLTFNGIRVDDIMNERPVNFSSGTVEFPTVQARRVLVDNLDVRLLNHREVIFEDGLHVDDDHQLAFLKVPEFHVRNLEVERLNGIEMNLTQLRNMANYDPNEIVVDGDLTVENLIVDQVDGRSVDSFLEDLWNSWSDIEIKSKRKIEHLVVQNITLKSLHGRNFNDWTASILSKSKEQTITGNFSAHVVTSDNVTITDFINKRNASQLMWVDGPLTITENVTFTDLFVKGDVNILKMNGRNVCELYDSLLYIPARNIDLLEVHGNISWETPSTSPHSISYLLNNAVTKDTNQVITGKAIFAKDVRAWAVSGNYKEIKEIEDVISDAVIDYGERIEINGTKYFEEDFIADSLTVNGDLGIAKINDVNILEFNDSVVRQNREETIMGPLTFLADVTVEKLYVNDADLNASVNAAIRIDEVIPDIHFEELEVLGDVNLQNLDTIDFDKFVKNRVTLSGDHDISCDVRFNGIVTVTGNAKIGKINGIDPSDFVLNDVDEVQIINGIKTFKEDLIVDGDVVAPRINNIDIMKEYNNGVQNTDEDVDIFGDLIFKADVRIQNLSTSGLVNNVDLNSIDNNSEEQINETLESLEKHWQIIEHNIERSSMISETLRNVFLYLEEEEDLEVPGTNVSKIDVVYFNESTIRLNMYSEQPGRVCWLMLNNCSCTRQSVVELVNKAGANRTEEMRKWQVNWKIVKNFHDPDEMFDVNLITTTVSSSKECIQIGTKPEHTVISVTWSKNLEMHREYVFRNITGYLKDAKIFKHDGNVYVVLAIYYDKARATHQTNSLVYRVHSLRNTASPELVQEIPTDGAWAIQIFKIEHHEIFLLIGCFGESSKSSLYKFDPITQKFEQLRTFASRSRYVKSLSQEKDYFILLDNPDTNAVNIYKYDPESRNFYSYQSIFHMHQINGIEYFYTDDFGNSDVFVIITTQSGQFYIYEYMFAGKFQMKMQHVVNGLQTMMPFYYANRHYILAGTDGNNIIFRIVKQGPH